MKRTVSVHNMHDKSTNQFMGLIKKIRINILSVFAILPFDQWCLLMYCSNFFRGEGGGVSLHNSWLPTITIVLHYRYWHAALSKTNGARLTYIIWKTCETFGYSDNIKIVGLKVGPLSLFIDM